MRASAAGSTRQLARMRRSMMPRISGIFIEEPFAENSKLHHILAPNGFLPSEC